MQVELLNTLSLSTQSIRIMIGMLGEVGRPPDSLLAEAGIEAALLDIPDATISGQQELAFQLAFAQETKSIYGFWLETGRRYRLMSYGPLGLAVLAAKDVSEGLDVLRAFQALTFSLMHYETIEDERGEVALTADDSKAPAELRQFLHERALGSVTMFLNDMVQAKFPLARIESRLDHKQGWQGCDVLLGTVVHFGMPKTRWVFAPGAAQAPLPMASPLLEQSYQQLCAKLIGDAEHVDPVIQKTYDLLVRSGRGFLGANRVADLLGISERTLHRRLDKGGSSFGKILDDIRLQRGKDLLEKSTLSVESIADMLGFAETSSFSRSFKRLTGTTPNAFRQRSGKSLR